MHSSVAEKPRGKGGNKKTKQNEITKQNQKQTPKQQTQPTINHIFMTEHKYFKYFPNTLKR